MLDNTIFKVTAHLHSQFDSSIREPGAVVGGGQDPVRTRFQRCFSSGDGGPVADASPAQAAACQASKDQHAPCSFHGRFVRSLFQKTFFAETWMYEDDQDLHLNTFDVLDNLIVFLQPLVSFMYIFQHEL